MNAHRVAARAFVWLILVLAASCASSGRLGRMSPLINDSARDRVSLWPLVYHSGNGTAVLWPIFDVDDKGFAVRPLVAKDGPRWEFLYPWASYDTRSGNGWALPFYSAGSNSGLFPIANFGKFSYVGLIWWKRDGAGALKSGGLFPLAHFGETSWVGPFWRGKESGGLFPLIHFGDFNYVGPVWWNSGSRAFGVFPLFATGGVRHVGPVWWKREAGDGFGAGVFPLLWLDRGGRDFAFLPFYSHDLGEESRTRNYLLGLVHTEKSKSGHESWALPFYFHRKSANRADTALFPFFWKRTRGDKSQVFTLLGNRAVDPASESFNLYPLWWSNDSKDSSWKMLLPLFYYGARKDERTLLTPLGGRAWSRTGATRYFNVLGPIYHHSRSENGSEERTAVLWPLFERHRDGEETTTRAAPFYSRTTAPDRSEGWYGLGLGHFQRSRSGSSHRLWPLYGVSDELHEPGFFYDATLYGSRSRGGTTRRHLFPLFAGETNAAGSEMSFLLGLGGYSRSKGNTSWRLWPLVAHSGNEGDSRFAHWTTLFGHANWPGHESWHIGGPFLYSSRMDETDGVRTRKRRLLTLFTDEQRIAPRDIVPLGTRAASENLVRQSEQAFLFGAFKHEVREYRVWREGALNEEEDRILSTFSSCYDGVPQLQRDEERARQILADRGRAPEQATSAALVQAIAGFAQSESEIVERRKLRLPLLYEYERTGKRVEWSGPLWLIRSKVEPEHSKFSILYYGFRSETKGDETRRDIFPFITLDTSPRDVNVSFLWRVFHYRRDGERRGGHVLFIPWGET